MAEIPAEIDLLTGRIAKLAYTEPTPDELALFDESWSQKMEELRAVDAELSETFDLNKSFYQYVLGVSKGYFDKPYGGKNASSGQFGDRILTPSDLYYMSTTKYNVWKKTITTLGWQDLFGSEDDPIKASTTSEMRSILAFHKLLSYNPTPKVMMYLWWVNRFPYIAQSIEPHCKISKAHKIFKMLPLPVRVPGGVVVHPGGEFYVRAAFEQTGDVEIATLGLIFAEYDYIKAELWHT